MLNFLPDWMRKRPIRSVQCLREQRQREVELALLDAEAEAERVKHTLAMLRERLRRLKK